jgi:Flp pilus assembly protein TadG
VRSERGQSLVEFALASFLFLMTFLGTIEFGLMVWHYNIVSDLAQEGARWAAVRGAGAIPSMRASTADVQTYVRTRSLGWPVTVTTFSADPITKVCTATATNPSALVAGDGLCVTVAQSFAPLTGVIQLAVWPNLQSTAQMIIAR